ncbi:MAG: translation initiation factor IF-2 [Planctomycetota bacterium]|nr:MAG: translation initiation factor IF-2 [Planctomycetota bacterium]
MASKRVFEIAKELGVKSKSIVDKCHAEGIPSEVIKNHMSTVSIGLEQTIREWFTAEEGSSTAVEQADKVDLDKVREDKPRKARKAAGNDGDAEDETGTTTAVVDAPKATPLKARPAKPATATTAAPAEEPATATTAPKPPAPGKPAPARIPAGLNARPPAADQPETPARPAASDERPDAGKPTRVVRPPTPSIRGPEAPPVMNVPTRPKVITPAGPKLEEIKKDKIKLSGPKVVRVEAPERLEPPRPPRGPRPGGGRGPSGPSFMDGPIPGRAPRGGNTRRRGGDRRRDDGLGEGPGGWSQADLAEREARLQRSGGYLKQKRQQLKSGTKAPQAAVPATVGGKVTIAEPFTIKELSAATGVKGADIVKKLFMQGIMATINSGIDAEKAQEIMIDWNIELEVTESKTAEQAVAAQFEDRERKDERPRGPVVTILGHVDHGKTSLLDKIRNTNVAAGEAGGITQATSAFRVPVKLGSDEKQVVFIDTPGHEAFTAMRARGAQVTDIVVLVVAADDGVMPQTKESISHAKAAGVPIIVALNKIDKPEATESNITKILGQLAEQGLNPTEWGGDTEVVRVSALKGQGIQELLEILDLQAQVLELTADFDGQAQGTVIEARPEEGRGNVANILIQEGKLKVGDFIVLGRAFGRVRDITDDRGNKLREAFPPMPVQISGINDLPDAGDKFYCVPSLKEAEKAAEQRRERERHEQLAQPKATLDRMFSQMAEADVKEILVVLKADVQGSVDVLKSEIEKVGSESSEVKVRVIHAAVGGITESDILLANASGGLIIGFNVIANAKGRALAEAKGVEIRNYQVIYDIVDDLKKAAEGLLAPELRQEVLGHAEVRQVFKITRVGMIAGCYVTDGVVQRDALIRVTRNGVVIENDRRLEQLKRVKDDVKEVRSGTECGMKIAGYDDIKVGDVLECYKQVQVARTL